jgi:hypothetical protein
LNLNAHRISARALLKAFWKKSDALGT